jgi:hypothetical protein
MPWTGDQETRKSGKQQPHERRRYDDAKLLAAEPDHTPHLNTDGVVSHRLPNCHKC